MKRIITILIVLALFLTSCQSAASTQLENITPEIQVTSQPTPTDTLTPEPTAEPTPSATPEPTEPKYIFIVIGDGFGRGAMILGEMYARIANESMDEGAVWESFPQQHFVEAMGESSTGGTAISTGYKTTSGRIASDEDMRPLYTIMDRAKEAGFSTGVITNSSIIDATPSTFTSHIYNRYNFVSVANQLAKSNVDYIAGGGMEYMLGPSLGKYYTNIDAKNYSIDYVGSETVVKELEELGYEINLGLDGALNLRENLESGDFAKKALYSLTGGIMPFEYYKYQPASAGQYMDVPSLVELTQAGVETLIQNEKGFIMMIEEADIDKMGHKMSQEKMIYQIRLLNDTLKYLMDFYNEHPSETLIILTADHETGNYKFDEEAFSEFKTLEDFTWTDDSNELVDFLENKWSMSSYEPFYISCLDKTKSSVFENEEDAKVSLYATLTLQTSIKYGTEIQTDSHSGQYVPLYTIGKKSDDFAEVQHIAEIPTLICEFMGWEPLPELIQ